MAWQTLNSRDGIYMVDWGVVGKMIRSYVRSRAMLHNSKVNSESQWFGPTLHTLDVDWGKVDAETDCGSEALLAQFYRNAQMNGRDQIVNLANLVEATKLNNAGFHKKMRDAQKQTIDNIEKSVAHYDTAITVARDLRDASAAFLMVSATIVTGGAAAGGAAGLTALGAGTGASAGTVATVAALGGTTIGAGLKATARAQDDRKATKGEVAATFASELAFGLLDLGAAKYAGTAAKLAAEQAAARFVGSATAKKLAEEAAKNGTQLALAILWNQSKLVVEPAKAVMQGKTVQEGLVKGGIKVGAGVHGELLKGGVETQILRKLIENDKQFESLAFIAEAVIDTAIDLSTDQAGEALVERGEKNERSDREEAPKIEKPKRAEHRLLDAIVYDRKLVQQTAFRQIGSAGSNPASSFRNFRSATGIKP